MLLQGHGAQFLKKINFFFYYLKKFHPGEGRDFRGLNFYHMSRKCPTRSNSKGVACTVTRSGVHKVMWLCSELRFYIYRIGHPDT